MQFALDENGNRISIEKSIKESIINARVAELRRFRKREKS